MGAPVWGGPDLLWVGCSVLSRPYFGDMRRFSLLELHIGGVPVTWSEALFSAGVPFHERMFRTVWER